MQQLASIAQEGEEREAPPGAILFREDDEAREVVFLLEGELKLHFRGHHLANVPPLSLVGEMGVLRKKPRVATAEAVTSCRYLALQAEDFLHLTEEDPELGRKFYRNLSAVLTDLLIRNNLLVEYLEVIGS